MVSFENRMLLKSMLMHIFERLFLGPQQDESPDYICHYHFLQFWALIDILGDSRGQNLKVDSGSGRVYGATY